MNFFSAEKRQWIQNIIGKFFRPLVALVLIIIGTGGWWFIIWPQIQNIQTVGLLTYTERVQLRDAKQRQLEQLKNLEKEYTQLNPETLQTLELIVPRGFDEAAMIATMEEFAQQADVKLKAIDITTRDKTKTMLNPELSADTVLPQGPIQAATVSLTLDMGHDGQNAYIGLKKFFKSMESFVPLMDLRDLSFSGDQTELSLQFQIPYF